ncbi:MAG: hypothetical protein HUK26_05400 [Duodenibacillus sp.]|nr:hypothetical protein [Duodenibacillus sp.]
MTAETLDFVTVVCLLLTAICMAYHILRLAFPLWGSRYEKWGDKVVLRWRALEPRPTSRQLRAAVPVMACFNRLVRGRDFSEEERPYRREFLFCFALLVASVLFSYLAQGAMDNEQLARLSVLLVLTALVVCMSALSRYRIFCLDKHVSRLAGIDDAKPQPAEDPNGLMAQVRRDAVKRKERRAAERAARAQAAQQRREGGQQGGQQK